jgi:hypothetical protein
MPEDQITSKSRLSTTMILHLEGNTLIHNEHLSPDVGHLDERLWVSKKGINQDATCVHRFDEPPSSKLHPRAKANVSLSAIFEIIMANITQNFRNICRFFGDYDDRSDGSLTPSY